VIVLYDIRGLSYREMSEVLDVPLGTVKSRLNRARQALREEMEPWVELFDQ
jgi:RNA polymerase sigma-70 factor (ECF subfamily)